MSSSTESLKKKVCVTVFLDELFEEVLDESNDPTNNLNDAGTKLTQTEVRPRKHRRESKFSENLYDIFQNELGKCGYDSDVKQESIIRETIESAFSDSEHDAKNFDSENRVFEEISKSSFSLISRLDVMSDENLLSMSFLESSSVKSVRCEKSKNVSGEKRVDGDVVLVVHRDISVQFDGVKGKDEGAHGEIHGDEYFHGEEEKNGGVEDDLFWKKTQNQIRMVLAKAKMMWENENACKGSQIKLRDANLLLRDCENDEKKNFFEIRQSNGSNISTDFKESDPQVVTNSPTFCVTLRTPSNESRLYKAIRVGQNSEANIWNNKFESDKSEPEHVHFNSKKVRLCSLKKDSLLRYNVCIKCKRVFFQKRDNEAIIKELPLASNVDPAITVSCSHDLQSKTSRDPDCPCLKTSFDPYQKGKEKKEGDTVTGSVERSKIAEEGDEKYADGNILRKTSSQKHFKLNSHLEAHEKQVFCEEISKKLTEMNVVQNEVSVECIAGSVKSDTCITSGRDGCKTLTEVFIKKMSSSNTDVSIIDSESENNLEKSESTSNKKDVKEHEVVSESTEKCHKILKADSKEEKFVCEGTHANSDLCLKNLRRIKTIEIIQDGSSSDTKKISTEIVLVCENVGNHEISFEAWEDGCLKSLTKMGQCYLKDSQDSAMYLIEVPLHFVSDKKTKMLNPNPINTF